ncbi:Gag-Pol polyprotein [Trachymyrmex cornetzi]|uniref:Gag-Pol polyprotein n=1 Tax=Trachymyrmex cornetzi TaxID=471704 RepID=A0A151IXX5_9HYME|nr:Gag-Pol polyprotein [Trachymyrmex cornetzi]
MAETWAMVIRRKAKRDLKKQTVPRSTGKNSRALMGQKALTEVKKKRPPRNAVVQIATEGDTTYADTLKMAKERISLEELGISELRPRRAKTGTFLLEIPGPDSAVKADALAMKLQETFTENGEIKISRPIKTAEIRIDNLDDSISSMDVLQTIVIATGCNHADIKLGFINVINRDHPWVKCPVVAANKLIDNKKIRIGWTTAKITSLPDRGLQCFKCLQFGHVRAECRSTADRSTTCYRCGEEGHQARECTKVTKCLVC